VARHRISELRTSGEALVGAIDALLERKQSRGGIHLTKSRGSRARAKRS
jgi:hypothetical protein